MSNQCDTPLLLGPSKAWVQHTWLAIAGGEDDDDQAVVTDETLGLHKPLQGFNEMGTRVRAKLAQAGSIDSVTPTTSGRSSHAQAAITPPSPCMRRPQSLPSGSSMPQKTKPKTKKTQKEKEKKKIQFR